MLRSSDFIKIANKGGKLRNKAFLIETVITIELYKADIQECVFIFVEDGVIYLNNAEINSSSGNNILLILNGNLSNRDDIGKFLYYKKVDNVNEEDLKQLMMTQKRNILDIYKGEWILKGTNNNIIFNNIIDNDSGIELNMGTNEIVDFFTIEIKDYRNANVYKYKKPQFVCSLEFIAGDWIYGYVDDDALGFNHSFMCAWYISTGEAVCVDGSSDFNIYSLVPIVE